MLPIDTPPIDLILDSGCHRSRADLISIACSAETSGRSTPHVSPAGTRCQTCGGFSHLEGFVKDKFSIETAAVSWRGLIRDENLFASRALRPFRRHDKSRETRQELLFLTEKQVPSQLGRFPVDSA